MFICIKCSFLRSFNERDFIFLKGKKLYKLLPSSLIWEVFLAESSALRNMTTQKKRDMVGFFCKGKFQNGLLLRAGDDSLASAILLDKEKWLNLLYQKQWGPALDNAASLAFQVLTDTAVLDIGWRCCKRASMTQYYMGKKKKKKGTKLLDQSFESPSPGQGEGKGLEVWKQQGGHAPHSHG